MEGRVDLRALTLPMEEKAQGTQWDLMLLYFFFVKVIIFAILQLPVVCDVIVLKGEGQAAYCLITMYLWCNPFIVYKYDWEKAVFLLDKSRQSTISKHDLQFTLVLCFA